MAFNKVQNPVSGDFATMQGNYGLTNEVNKLSDKPLLNGSLLAGISLSTSEKSIDHKLGKKYQGFIITKLNANAVVWASSTTDSDKFLKLTASASCTVDLWVF